MTESERSTTERCAGHVFDDGKLLGCPEDVVTYTEATGTLTHDGLQIIVGLCADHTAAVMFGGATMTFTLTEPIEL